LCHTPRISHPGPPQPSFHHVSPRIRRSQPFSLPFRRWLLVDEVRSGCGVSSVVSGCVCMPYIYEDVREGFARFYVDDAYVEELMDWGFIDWWVFLLGSGNPYC
jgi:hypothetical protein